MFSSVQKNTLAATLNKSCAELFSKTQSARKGSEGCAAAAAGGLEVARGEAAGVVSVSLSLSLVLSAPRCLWVSVSPPPSTGERERGTRRYHRSHLFFGFMGAPALQPKCFEKSRELDTVPMTRNLDGLWGSVMMPSCELSGVLAEHHTCSQDSRGRDCSEYSPRS